MILVQGLDFFNQSLVKYPLQSLPGHGAMKLVTQISTKSNSSPLARLVNAPSCNSINGGDEPCE